MHDLVISGGLVVDGTGGAPRIADVAVDGGRITAVERPGVVGDAAETIDATGRIVTPGFVDIHCHYDGQATWDPLLEPSSLHGITTVVVGNCGVGFAPGRPRPSRLADRTDGRRRGHSRRRAGRGDHAGAGSHFRNISTSSIGTRAPLT